MPGRLLSGVRLFEPSSISSGSFQALPAGTWDTPGLAELQAGEKGQLPSKGSFWQRDILGISRWGGWRGWNLT